MSPSRASRPHLLGIKGRRRRPGPGDSSWLGVTLAVGSSNAFAHSCPQGGHWGARETGKVTPQPTPQDPMQ